MPLRNDLHFFSITPLGDLQGNERHETRLCNENLRKAKRALCKETLELMKGTTDNLQNFRYLRMLQGVYDEDLPDENGVYPEIRRQTKFHHPDFPPGTPLTGYLVPMVRMHLRGVGETATESGVGGNGASLWAAGGNVNDAGNCSGGGSGDCMGSRTTDDNFGSTGAGGQGRDGHGDPTSTSLTLVGCPRQ
jgi:hypothetical protein